MSNTILSRLGKLFERGGFSYQELLVFVTVVLAFRVFLRSAFECLWGKGWDRALGPRVRLRFQISRGSSGSRSNSRRMGSTFHC